MLYDRATIFVEAGRGGDGCVSFRREAHVPKGGPDGGDGGRGGDVVLLAGADLRDLSGFRRKKHFKAGRGGHGEGSQKTGPKGETLTLPVPPGTVVRDSERGSVTDLSTAGQRVVVAKGGGGGRGNKRFATATRQAPRFAEKGVAGESRSIELQLKLLSDVGLIGRPNAGKSSILRGISRARPKVAEYPFTTKEPVLGTVELDSRQLVIADIPGLIEGASKGAGMGHEFLSHIERTKLLVHVVELAPIDGTDPAANYETVEKELGLHLQALIKRPRIVALNKADLMPTEEAQKVLAEWRNRLGGSAIFVLLTSAASGNGLNQLVEKLFETIGEDETAQEPSQQEGVVAEYRLYRPAEGRGFKVAKSGDGVFEVRGKGVEMLVERTDTGNEEALEYLEQRLRQIGVIDALEREGFRSGDEVKVGQVAFVLEI